MATFVTSTGIGRFVGINIQTSTDYYKYIHNGTESGAISTISTFYAEVLNINGEFTIISCLSDGTDSGDIIYLDLNSN